MENTVIEKTVIINAPVSKVWNVFTDPAVTKQMGGYYDTDWKPGSSFGFRNMQGNKVTNGELLEFEPGRLIKHDLRESDNETILSVITYEFREEDGATILTGKEVMKHPLEQTAFDDAEAGWEFALKAVKDLAEKL
ncbi:SRPBCC family protein [Niabella beijingensis]|uniref:SRPBCC family protein n=1 Tax=Niabella beijingensis TaxID=2872700 RepID=UPI001CBF6BED|nr:SRPBCC domain-containing protein [Niabella beijingensis]MBZ4188120.1 SRPBCC domain-containing protein [Niabella beijingensis]